MDKAGYLVEWIESDHDAAIWSRLLGAYRAFPSACKDNGMDEPLISNNAEFLKLEEEISSRYSSWRFWIKGVRGNDDELYWKEEKIRTTLLRRPFADDSPAPCWDVGTGTGTDIRLALYYDMKRSTVPRSCKNKLFFICTKGSPVPIAPTSSSSPTSNAVMTHATMSNAHSFEISSGKAYSPSYSVDSMDSLQFKLSSSTHPDQLSDTIPTSTDFHRPSNSPSLYSGTSTEPLSIESHIYFSSDRPLLFTEASENQIPLATSERSLFDTVSLVSENQVSFATSESSILNTASLASESPFSITTDPTYLPVAKTQTSESIVPTEDLTVGYETPQHIISTDISLSFVKPTASTQGDVSENINKVSAAPRASTTSSQIATLHSSQSCFESMGPGYGSHINSQKLSPAMKSSQTLFSRSSDVSSEPDMVSETMPNNFHSTVSLATSIKVSTINDPSRAPSLSISDTTSHFTVHNKSPTLLVPIKADKATESPETSLTMFASSISFQAVDSSIFSSEEESKTTIPSVAASSSLFPVQSTSHVTAQPSDSHTPGTTEPPDSWSRTPWQAWNSSGDECGCTCDVNAGTVNGGIDLEALKEQIRRELNVDVSKLSATVRRLTSIPDFRPSATAISVPAITFVVILLFAIVISDLLKLYYYVWGRGSKYD